MSTVAELLTRSRDEVDEDTAEEWEDTTLIRYINDEHDKVLSQLAQIPDAGWGQFTEKFTVAADTETFDLSGLTHDLEAIGTLWHVTSSGHEQRVEVASEAQFNLLRLATTTVTADTIPWYSLERTAGTESLRLLPKSVGIRTFRITYDYATPVLTSGQDLHTPKRYDDLIAARVKRRALAKLGEYDEALDVFIQRREDEMLDREGSAANRARAPRIETDFSEELWF